MGELKFDGREYLLLEIVTDQGLTGLGFGMTRDAPLAAVVAKNIAPRLLGTDALATEKAWQTLYDTNLTIGQRGIFMRGLSAVGLGNVAVSNGRSMIVARPATSNQPLRMRKLWLLDDRGKPEAGPEAFRGVLFVAGNGDALDGFEEVAANHAVLVSRDLKFSLADLEP